MLERKSTPSHALDQLLKTMPVFAALPNQAKDHLINHGDLVDLRRGECLWQKQDTANFCAILNDGLVEIRDTTNSGTKRILALFGPGDIIGLPALLKRISYPAAAYAATPRCQLIRIRCGGFDLESSAAPQTELQTWLQTALLQHEDILRDKLYVLGTEPLHNRLIALFDQLRRRFSTSEDKTHFFIPYQLTKTQLAHLVEARVETVIRLLNQWEKKGHLLMSESGIEIKLPPPISR